MGSKKDYKNKEHHHKEGVLDKAEIKAHTQKRPSANALPKTAKNLKDAHEGQSVEFKKLLEEIAKLYDQQVENTNHHLELNELFMMDAKNTCEDTAEDYAALKKEHKVLKARLSKAEKKIDKAGQKKVEVKVKAVLKDKPKKVAKKKAEKKVVRKRRAFKKVVKKVKVITQIKKVIFKKKKAIPAVKVCRRKKK